MGSLCPGSAIQAPSTSLLCHASTPFSRPPPDRRQLPQLQPSYLAADQQQKRQRWENGKGDSRCCYLTLLFMAHKPELSHRATHRCKGTWETQLFILTTYVPGSTFYYYRRWRRGQQGIRSSFFRREISVSEIGGENSRRGEHFVPSQREAKSLVCLGPSNYHLPAGGCLMQTHISFSLRICLLGVGEGSRTLGLMLLFSVSLLSESVVICIS